MQLVDFEGFQDFSRFRSHSLYELRGRGSDPDLGRSRRARFPRRGLGLSFRASINNTELAALPADRARKFPNLDFLKNFFILVFYNILNNLYINKLANKFINNF